MLKHLQRHGVHSLKRAVIVIALLIVIAAATLYTETIKYQVAKFLHLPYKSVKGASTTPELPTYLQKDVLSGVDIARKQAMQVKVGDIVNFLGRSQKMLNDAKSAEEFIVGQADNFLQHKK